MRINTHTHYSIKTHEGAKSSYIPPKAKLERLVMSCMLWEDTFYVDGETISNQIVETCKHVTGDFIVELAQKVHSEGKLRHIPLFLIVQALKKKAKCATVIADVCNRPDQMTELLALYWKEGKKPIPAQLKKGLGYAFKRFDEYQLAKYNRPGIIKLRDILRLIHPKPMHRDQEKLWHRLMNDELKTPDTWETNLSAGADKKETFSRLLSERKMGSLAVLRNVRNMYDAGVDKQSVKYALLSNSRKLLPFQFIAAARACPQWEDIIDESLQKMSFEQFPDNANQKTVIFVDVSYSMQDKLSKKGITTRMDAATGLSIILREATQDPEFYSFSNELRLVPSRHGMALGEALVKSQSNSSTNLLGALTQYVHANMGKEQPYRVIVITDEQISPNTSGAYFRTQANRLDVISKFPGAFKYIINVGTYENGIKNGGSWHVINGFSENVIDYIREYESAD